MADGHPRRNGLRTADTHTDPPAVDRDGTQSQHGSRSRVGYDADAVTSGKEWVSVHFPVSSGPASERLTSSLRVQRDLGKRRSAQRWAVTYSHGGVLVGSLTIG
jgi:hypothetical protein